MRLLAILLCLVSAGVALAGDNYYLWVFGYQGRGRFNLPRHSHSFALFVKITEKNEVEPVTISWLPRDGSVRIFHGAEPGFNHSIPSTFAIIQNHGYQWQNFGPYEIQGELFERAKKRVNEQLAPARVWYEAIPKGRPNWSTNCIHAISDLDRDRGAMHSGDLRGISASQALVAHLNRWRVGGAPKDDVTRLVAEKLRFPLWYLR